MQDALKGCPYKHPGRFVHHADHAAYCACLLSCPPLPWLTPLMRVQALVMDVRPAYRFTLLAPAADCRVSLPHLPSPTGRCCFTPPGRPLAEVLSQCKTTTLALLVVQVYGLYHLLRQLKYSTSEVAVTC